MFYSKTTHIGYSTIFILDSLGSIKIAMKRGIKGYRNKVIVSFFLAGINVDNNIAYVKVTLGNESFTDNIVGKYFIVARDITFDNEHKSVVPIIKFYNERDEEISLD